MIATAAATTAVAGRAATGFNPYVGPNPYTREDVEAGREFHGREWETGELLDLLVAKRIVLLYSPSGAGKTSLIQARLVPALEKEGFEVLPAPDGECIRTTRSATSRLTSSRFSRSRPKKYGWPGGKAFGPT